MTAMDLGHEIQIAVRELLDITRRSPASGELVCSKVLDSIKAGIIEIKHACQQGVLERVGEQSGMKSHDRRTSRIYGPHPEHDADETVSFSSFKKTASRTILDKFDPGAATDRVHRLKKQSSSNLIAQGMGVDNYHDQNLETLNPKRVILSESKTVSKYGSDTDSRQIEKSKGAVDENSGGRLTRRNRQNKLKDADLEAVLWLENQLNSQAALTSMLKLTEDWTNISRMIFDPQRTAVAMSPVLTRSQPSDDLSLLIYLGGKLSVSATEAWANAILRRIHCAFFYRLYTAAIEDARRGPASLFFQLSDERIKACGETPIRKSYKGYTSSAAVRDRLVDLIFLNPAERPRISQGQCRERIHISHQDGKRWWRLFQTLDYEILLCLSPEVTDNRIKLTDAQMSILLSAWEEHMRLMSRGRLLEIKRVMEETFMPYIRMHETIFEKQQGFSSLSSPTIYRRKSFILGGEASVEGITKLSPAEMKTAPTDIAADDRISSEKHVEARSGHPYLLAETVEERSGVHAERIWQDGVEGYSVPVVPDLTTDEVGEMIDDLMRSDQSS